MTQPVPEWTADEQAHLDLHAPRLVPPATRERDDVDQHVDTVTLEGDYL
ncbi:hypothetical protein ACWDXD_33400 [Streptomyces sp. NPDC003314]